MATVTTGTQTTNEVRNPTCYEIFDYMLAVDELYSHRAMYIKGYDTGKFELMYWDFEDAKIMRCVQIASEFKKKYLKFKF